MSSVEVRVCGRYRLESILKRSQFKTIYMARNVQTNQVVIVKAEESKNKYANTYTLLQEGKVMQSLQGGIGIPSMHWCGQQEDYNFIVMEQLGKNLQELYEMCNRNFKLKTVLMLGDQLISILQYYHFKNYVHRGVKPANFLMGLGKKNHKLYMIDYSTTKRYRDTKSLEHNQFREGPYNPENIIFSGIQANKGVQASRRDDIQSMILMLIYFLKGLPWYKPEPVREEAAQHWITKQKIDISVDELCKGIPREFNVLLNYARNIPFDEKPDYIYIKNILRQRLDRQGLINDSVYDWMLIPPDIKNIEQSLYIPLTLEVIPNQEEFIKAHLDLYNREIEENQENQEQDRQNKGQSAGPADNKATKKQKECTLF